MTEAGGLFKTGGGGSDIPAATLVMGVNEKGALAVGTAGFIR